MIGALYVLNFKGDIIIQRCIRPDVPITAINHFRVNIVHSTTSYAKPPVNKFDRYHFLHIMLANGIWLVAIVTENVNVMMVFQFLHHIKKLIIAYVGFITEDQIFKKFTLLMELLEEVQDYGNPQITDVSSLRGCITQKTLKNAGKVSNAAEITNQLTGQITWRKPGIKYQNNEIYLDVIENVHLLMSSQGRVLSSHITGALVVRALLSGMPECKCGINDKFLVEAQDKDKVHGSAAPKISVALDDCVFHQCVKLSKQDAAKSMTFIPPDGKFELLKYRASNDVFLPFKIFPLIKDIGQHKKEISVALRSTYKESQIGSKIEVLIPVPDNSSKVTITTSKGRSKYRKGDNVIAWRIRFMHGNKEARLGASIDLTQVVTKKNVDNAALKDKKKPISLKFTVPFSCCGMKIRFLKVLESKLNYGDEKVVKWVRYKASEGNYEFRI